MRTLRVALAVVCILVIALSAVLIVQKIAGRARVDLTQHGLYTLSDGTRNVVGKLNQTVKLKLFYSRTAAMKGPDQIRFYNNYYLYVRALLEEYVGLSGGRLTLEIIDPRRFSDEEEEAIGHELRQFPLSENESFFFGLVVQTELGKAESIPFFEPNRQEFVEYDVSKLIATVVRREKTKIGVLSSLPVAGEEMSPYMMQMMRMQGRQPPAPWHIVQHLQQEYEVVPVKKDAASIDADVDFLMVVHPKEMGEKMLYAIDQFVMKGGKLLVFVDPHCLADQPMQDPSNPMARLQHKAASGLGGLLKGWGVEMDEGVIAADRGLAVAIRQRDGIARLATYMALDGRCVNEDEVVTAKLHDLRMLFPGVLKKVKGAAATVTPLLTTTEGGSTWKPKSPFELQAPDAVAINRAVKPAGKLMLACRISGKLKTNFPDGIQAAEDADEKGEKAEDEDEHEKGEDKGEKTEDEDEEAEEKGESGGKKAGDNKEPGGKEAKADEKPEPEVLKEASPDAVVIVFADVDMITDMVAYEQSFFGTAMAGDNASAVLNAIEFLGGTGDLIAIRSRGRVNRPFVVVDKIEAEAEKATAKEVEKLNKKIDEFEAELRELGARVDEKNLKLVQSEAVVKYKKLQEDKRQAEKEKRKLSEYKRNKIETLALRLKVLNMLLAPAAVLAIAIALAVVRYVRARYYTAQRA
ncbi:MAG: Gldg family protein [Planctomycetota bacterium]